MKIIGLIRRGSPFLWIGLIICTLLLVGLVVSWFTPRPMVVLDPKFQVLNWKISIGKEHIMYDGNQTMCRVNHWLRRTTGLDVLHRGGLSFSSPRKTYGFLLRYRGDMNSDDLRNLKAFMIAPDGFSMEVPRGAGFTSPGTYLTCYLLTDAPTNRGPYILVLKLPSTGRQVATWNIGELH